MEILQTSPAIAVIVPTFYISIGIIFFNSIHSAVIGFSGHRRLLYLTLAACGVIFIAFQYSTIRYYLSQSVTEAAEALRWQIGAAAVFMPLFYCMVVSYSEQPALFRSLPLIAILYAILFVINFNAPFSLRYSHLEKADPIIFSWGEQLAYYRGTFSESNTLFRIINNAVAAYLFVPIVKMFQAGRKRAAFLLGVCNVLFILAAIWGTLIDAGEIKSVYIVGFTYLAFIALISLSLGIDLRDNNRRLKAASIELHEEIQRREEIEYAIKQVAQSASSHIGENYFRRLVSVLANLFDSENAKIGIYDEKDRTITTLALLINGKLAANISYPIANTPCANALEYGTFYSTDEIAKLFPHTKFLTDLHINSYLGIALRNSEGKALGVITLFSAKPLHKAGMAEEIIDIISARTVAEIERMRSEQLMRTMAYRDYLTGLANRASLQQHLNAMIHKSTHLETRGAMLLIDLDHFKTINDALSHDVGDEVLRKVGHRISESVADKGFAARLGGDEFVVVIDPQAVQLNQIRTNALQLANRIAKILSQPIEIGEHALNIGASIGIATYPNRSETSLDLLRHADMALYQAKNLGRSNVQFYESPMQTAAYNRLLLEKGLRKALESNQLSLSFQPQVNAPGEIIGAEVLLRWRHPKLGDVPPSSFIPLAEETGLIHSLGSWVLHQVCARLIEWQQLGIRFPGRLSVNVSPWQFTRVDFVTQIYNTFALHGVSPTLVTLEITESALMYDLNETIEKLGNLREMGLYISLDDFGTGYSSLSYLKQLPLDEIKIDQSFVRELNASENHPLVESMIAIGRHMHLKVIAEGVENGLQRDRLLTMGCERFQGFWYCQPLADADFQNWLKQYTGQTEAKNMDVTAALH